MIKPSQSAALTALVRGPQNAVAFWGSRTAWEPLEGVRGADE